MRSGSRSPGPSQRALARCGPGELAEPLLDTLLQKRDILLNLRRKRKLFSRANIGMMLAGDYYFLTFTSKPGDKPIESKWEALAKWLRRQKSDIEWVYCITNEGLGVIHMIFRLPEGDKRISQKVVQEYWGAWVIIKEVHDKTRLANYMSDQRRRGLALEMYSQETIMRYRMSKNWVPRAFMVAFGRFYYKNSNLDDTTLNELLRDWVVEVKNNYDIIKLSPRQRGNTVKWCNQYDKTFN